MAVNSFSNLVVLLLCLGNVFGIEDYCSENNYNSSDKFMHFTKEATYREFALIRKFKGLHCCAKGYRSIEWIKDGTPYPWALPISHLILFPDNANQTIYANFVTEEDAGNYTCVLRNDTVVHTHTIQLEIFEKLPDEPKITFISQDTDVAIGQSLRLFCEAFVGQVDLPDAHNEAVWLKINPNGTTQEVPSHVQQLKSTREEGQIFGTYLIIPMVQKEDFGDYVCIISKPGNTIERMVTISKKVNGGNRMNPNPVPMGKLILTMSVILFVGLSVIILYVRYGLKIQVHIKDSFNSLEENDGKDSDILIVHSPKDSEIVSALLATLENNYNYKCTSQELSAAASMWYSELQDEAQKSRRLLAVLSPALVNENWDTSTVLQALKQLQSLSPKLICVALKDLPKAQNEIKNSQGETLTSLSCLIGLILWDRKMIPGSGIPYD